MTQFVCGAFIIGLLAWLLGIRELAIIAFVMLLVSSLAADPPNWWRP